jgi:predicted ATPase/class 3 adenylate cyclase
MKFSEIVDQARALLQRTGKLTYEVLRREFALDDESLEDLKEQFIHAEEVAVDKDGRMLVWKGENAAAAPVSSAPPQQSPASYTPSHLAERIRAEQAALEARGHTEGERKTITALFADLKGSTALIEGLDPEEARGIIDPALQIMMEAVHCYEGYVAQALGDGIFALFGAPLAHEDHPQRALYAALRMQEEMRRYSDQLRLKGGVPLYLRVGVNTGEVVVRSIRKDDLHTDYVPVGHATNLAARMEQMATPGSILVTAYTHKLTEGYFAFKALGGAQIKGVEAPLKIYEVLGAGPLRTRLQIAATRGLIRFVGRQREMEQLRSVLAHATAGQGQIVGVMGEPGVGKSRLFYEFKLTAQSGSLVLEAYSVSHGKASPYLPLIELLKTYFQIQLSDDARTRRERVIGKVLGLERSLEDTLPYLFVLLGIDDPASSLQQMDPQVRRRRTFEALKKILLRESLNQPLILVFEDLHWIDSETQGFLEVLSESVASARILLLTNYRPEYRHEWGNKTYYTQLRLAPFGREEAEEFLTALLSERRVPQAAPLRQFILAKTEGIPFFMEEVVQALQEQGLLSIGVTDRSPLPTDLLRLPATVQGVLAARIDRLSTEEKTLLQQLAVIGREFPLSLARQVVSLSEEALYRLLASLQRKEFLYEQPAFPEVEYIFKHALTQEVTYGTVLQELRKTLHGRTAQVIETLYSASLDEHYSELAHHYSRSGNTPKAIDYLYRAGQQAMQRSATTEAITSFTAALEFVQSVAETPERAQQELTLQLALAPPLTVTKGYTAPEVGAVSARALTLCRQIGNTPQLFPALWGAANFYLMRGELPTAQELAERLLPLAQQTQEPALLQEAHGVLGTVLMVSGEAALARLHYEQALTLYDPGQRYAAIVRYGADVGVWRLSQLAHVLWVLGYPDQALVRNRAALTLAQEIAHPYTTASVWLNNMLLRQFRREAQAVQQQADALIVLCNEQGFSSDLAVASGFRGWALAQQACLPGGQGQAEEGVQQIRQSLAITRAAGAQAFQPYFLALLAEAQGKTGHGEAGVTALTEALAVADRTGVRLGEAE